MQSVEDISTNLNIPKENLESHRNNVLLDIYKKSQFCDATIVNEEEEFQVHKLILSTSSPVLRRIFERTSQPHPLLYFRGEKTSNIQALLNFIYTGNTAVKFYDLPDFIKLATELQIYGIVENKENLLFGDGEDSDQSINRINSKDVEIEKVERETEELLNTELEKVNDKLVFEDINETKDNDDEDTSVRDIEDNTNTAILASDREDLNQSSRPKSMKLKNIQDPREANPQIITIENREIFYKEASKIFVLNGDKSLLCTICNFTTIASKMHDHVGGHFKGLFHFVCHLCGVDFTGYQRFFRHMLAHHKHLKKTKAQMQEERNQLPLNW